MIYVYHRKPRVAALYPDYGTAAEKIDYVQRTRTVSYIEVVGLELTNETLDEAYAATQNGIHEGYANWVDLANDYEGNVLYVDKARSTMIGDIIRKDGKDYIVDNCGFLEVK